MPAKRVTVGSKTRRLAPLRARPAFGESKGFVLAAPPDTYETYVTMHRGLTPCQKSTLLNYRALRRRMDPATTSNAQIRTLYAVATAEGLVEQTTRLFVLLSFFLPVPEVTAIFAALDAAPMDVPDERVVETVASGARPAARDKFRKCNKWLYEIQLLSARYISRFGVPDPRAFKYLDVGCGGADKTRKFQQYLRLGAHAVHGADIRTWGPYDADKDKLGIQFSFIENGVLAHADNSVDLITCIYTLHHVPDRDAFAREMRRVLKPGGVLLLIEHCVYTDYDCVLVNIQHMLFSAMNHEPNSISDPTYIDCQNMYEWDYTMLRAGLAPIEKAPASFENEYKLTYENPFYGFYRK